MTLAKKKEVKGSKSKKVTPSNALTPAKLKAKGHSSPSVLSPDEIKVIEFLKGKKGGASIKEIAKSVFGTEMAYLKVKNLKRRPIKLGEMKLVKRGVYAVA